MTGGKFGRRFGLSCAAATILGYAALPGAAVAEVEVDLSAIGLRTELDERIAPGQAPVELRFPGATSSKRILLTPPPSMRDTETAPAPAPSVLAPAGSEAVAPAVIAPPAAAKATAAPLLPVEQAPAAAPAIRAADPAPEEPDTAVQTASLPPPGPASHRLRFESGTAELLNETEVELELIAAELMRHSDRIEIQAYAGAAGDLSSDVRRLSLQRGLAVRKKLVDHGVLQSRIDVRAQGGVRDSGPGERVDIILSNR